MFPWTGLLGLALNTEQLQKKMFDYDVVIMLDLAKPLLTGQNVRDIVNGLRRADIVTLDKRGLNGPIAMNYKGILNLAHYGYIMYPAGPYEQNITMTNGFKFAEPMSEVTVNECHDYIKKRVNEKKLTTSSLIIDHEDYDPYLLCK